MALLEVRGLTKRFGGLTAVSGVDLDVEAGEIVSVIGPNGAGKTTLFELICGNLALDGGEVRFQGKNLAGLPPHAIARRGLVRTFQASRVFAHMTVLEHVLVGAHGRIRYGFLGALARPPRVARAEREARTRAMALLGLFGTRLTPRAADFVITLSFANRRRAEIARDLAAEPRLVLFDEPAAGMNPSEKRQIAGHIREIRSAARRCCSSSTTWRPSWRFPTASSCSTTARRSPRALPRRSGRIRGSSRHTWGVAVS